VYNMKALFSAYLDEKVVGSEFVEMEWRVGVYRTPEESEEPPPSGAIVTR
jgi:hypothetical protein